MTERFFPFACDSRYAVLGKLTGLRPGRDGVTITDDTFRARYGRLSLETPIANVRGGHLTEGYQWFKAIGPRLSMADDGLTFGTNTDRGVCVHFDQRVRRVIGLRDHSAVTVTVDDCEGLLEAIGSDDPR